MRIIFMGTPQFAIPSLEILLNYGYDICAVVTVPDKKKGRGLKLSEPDVKKYAISKGLNILQPENSKEPAFIEKLRSLDPDLIIVVAFRILPREVFTIPKLGSFNLHASLLPKYRGAAPVNWAIINGEKITGVSTFFLKEKVDTGNIILQKEIEITSDDTAGSLSGKLSVLGAEAVLDTVKLIERNEVQTLMQDDSLATPAPKIFHDDCRINWNNDVYRVHDFIRGLSPYPGAFTYLDGKMIKILFGRAAGGTSSGNDAPGKIISENKSIFVQTGLGIYEILRLKPEGKKEMSAQEFINGLRTDKKADLNFSY
jgi:methionyl-tRNA formyltransferase